MFLPMDKKIAFWNLVVDAKSMLDDMFDSLEKIVNVVESGSYAKHPLNSPAIALVREVRDGEHGQLLRALRTKFHDIYARLQAAKGDDAAVFKLILEVGALLPGIAKLDEQMDEMHKTMDELHKTIEQRIKAFVERN